MTIYEVIKNMSEDEMAITLFFFVEPWVEDETAEEKNKILQGLKDFLRKDVNEN